MWLNPFPRIWREDPARIPIPGDASGALERLRARTPRNGFRAGFKEGCVGLVDAERVKIRHYRPFGRRSIRLVLDATVAHDGRAAMLVGTFRAPQQVRVAATIWLGMVLLFVPTFFLSALAMWGTDRAGALAFMTMPSVFYIAACAIVTLNSRKWEESRMYIERFLSESFVEPAK